MIDYKSEIEKLKKEKNAIILAHYYQRGEVQDIADFTGDSLYLSQIARDSDADIICFCGVHFMAETAKILAPNKKVIIPRFDAGCPMADTATYEDVLQYKKNNPDTFIVSYVNTTAKVKALSDVCVTSSNAEKIIRNFTDKKILYIPDKNLGSYLRKKYNLELETWPGFCYVHDRFDLDEMLAVKKENPEALMLVHPEMKIEIVEIADFVGSTKALLEFTKKSPAKKFIIGTENGIIHQMKKANPDKEFIQVKSTFSCFNMKKTHLADVYYSLLNEMSEIKLPPEILTAAYKPLKLMFEITEKNE